MDYKGQQLCEQLYQFIIAVFSVVAFVVGYVEQSFRLTFLISCAGLFVAAVVCVPDWPCFNRHPLPWQEPVEGKEAGTGKEGVEGGAGEALNEAAEEKEKEVNEEVKVKSEKKAKKKKKERASTAEK